MNCIRKLELFQADVLWAHLIGKEYAGMVLKLVCTLGGEIANGALLGAACFHFGMAMEVVVQTAGYIRSLGHHTDSLGDVATDGGQKNGVMGAAEDERINGWVGMEDKIDTLLDKIVSTRGARLVILNDRHPERTGHTCNGDVGR